jgi:hypothetical protein
MVEEDVLRAKTELASLMHQRQIYDHSGRAVIPVSSASGIREYHNMFLCESIIDSVITDNRQRKKESAISEAPTKFRHILDLPHFREIIREQSQNVSALYVTHVTKKEIIREKQIALAHQFCQYHEHWTEMCDRVDEYSTRVRILPDKWPPEFPKGRTKSDNPEDLRKWMAPDQPMYMCRSSAMAGCGLDGCGLVDDPVLEHEEFRGRLTWSEEEQKKFLSKYTQHPKKFRLIAESLPLKSVKDVIEFYYVNRYRLSLKEKEGVRRKRGGVKRVFSEGSAKVSRPVSTLNDYTV